MSARELARLVADDGEAPEQASLTQDGHREDRPHPRRGGPRAAGSRRLRRLRCPAPAPARASPPSARRLLLPCGRTSRWAWQHGPACQQARSSKSSGASSYSKIDPPSSPDSSTARVTMVVSTVSRSSEEQTACPTSPSAVSCPTERVQLRRPRLQLVEQAHVLDGDHGLVGEGREKRDLRGGERRGLRGGPGLIAPMTSLCRSMGTASTLREPRARRLASASAVRPASSGAVSKPAGRRQARRRWLAGSRPSPSAVRASRSARRCAPRAL